LVQAVDNEYDAPAGRRLAQRFSKIISQFAWVRRPPVRQGRAAAQFV